MNLQELVSEAQNGNTAAGREICRRFAGLVKKYAGQHHIAILAAEARAEGWLAVMEAVKTYDARTGVPFPGYVESKVKYAVWNLFKRERRRWQTEISLDRETESAGGDDQRPLFIPVAPNDVAAEAENRWLRRETRRLIARLPDRQRQAVTAIGLEGKKLAETAALMGISPQAVHNLYRRGLNRLQTWAGTGL